MRILLLRTWLTNVGNGFIDSGARALLEESFPSSEIIELSGYPYHLGDLRASFNLKKKINPGIKDDKRSDHPKRTNMTNLHDFFDFDVAILPGCVLYEHAFRKLLPVLKQIRKQGTPIMLIGAGGGNYTPDTQSYVKNILDELSINVLLTRDSTAYECYHDCVQYSYDGIDCAFFIDKWYEPPKANNSFEVRTFDKTAEPELSSDHSVVRATHTPFDSPFNFPIKERLHDLNHSNIFDRNNLFIADKIEDYLMLYANAVRTHSDRIHACVPSLVYGNNVQFHYDTPRAKLFKRVLDGGTINTSLVSLDQSAFNKERKAQIDATSEAIKYLKEN